ncbi:hypothetical protein EXS70_03670, partial [Candidatus Peribacteria bacterium]|nr:hypothetical protein [Candidatus Peribacteria bacterium]
MAFLGSLSPLLTLSWLWQIKEWRWDRLLEHLRREGWVGQLWGEIRSSVVGIYAAGVMVGWLHGWMVSEGVIVLMLSIVTGLGLMQVILRKQRRPVPTKKAITVTGTAALLTLIVTIVVSIMGFNVLLPFIILLQPVMIACAWLLWWPVDSVLKARIMQKARALRNSHSDMTVIGVTGSVGKTTTKELIACVLKDLKPDVTPAYVNSEIGVANWLSDKLRITDYGLRESKSEIRNPKLFVVEMGAYQKGEIALMCSFVKPTLGVVTMVGTQHIA